MKTILYRRDDKKFDVLVLPAVHRRLPPVLVQGVTRDDLKSELGKVIAAVRGEPAPDAVSS